MSDGIKVARLAHVGLRADGPDHHVLTLPLARTPALTTSPCNANHHSIAFASARGDRSGLIPDQWGSLPPGMAH